MLYNNGNFEVYTTVDGLYKVDLSSISKDNYKNIWIGGKSSPIIPSLRENRFEGHYLSKM